MSSLRLARATARLRPLPICLRAQRRNYAEAVSDKIKLTLALPHQVSFPKLSIRNVFGYLLIYHSPFTSQPMCMSCP